jgi:hypothetical protein
MATMVPRAGGDCKKKAPVLMIEYALAGAALPLGSRAAACALRLDRAR